MKRIVFLVIVSLLVIGFVLPGCAGGGGNGVEEFTQWITFAVAGPMTKLPGEHLWWGAELARDEINDYSGVGGIDVEGTPYGVKLVQVDTNEWSGTPDEGVNALQAVIDDVDFVLGGFQEPNVDGYREVAMDAQRIFMNCGCPNAILQYSVVKDYDRYKYWFKVNPTNESFFVNSFFKMTIIFGQLLKQTLEDYGDAVAEDYRVPEDGKLRMAIVMEDWTWADAIVAAAQAWLPSYDFTVVGIWRPSGNATDISIELSQIADVKPHIILCGFYGPVSLTYSKQRADLGIPAMTIGINLEGRNKAYWMNTDGKCNGEIMLDNWTGGLESTAKTTSFFNAFVAKTGEYPIYTASTYDAIYSLKEAIEAVSAAHGWDDIADVIDPTNIDVLIQYLETSSYIATSGKIAYYPIPEIDLGGGVYALSEAQVRALYPTLETYNQADWLCAASGGPHIAHDLVYGPSYMTSIGSQWQDGYKVGVWPIDLGDDYDVDWTDKYGNWNFEYPGTVDVVMPIEGFLVS